MAALQSASRVESFQPATAVDVPKPMVRLAMLHAEAQDTARLANLLGRSTHAAIALVLMTIAALAFGSSGLAEGITWGIFTLAGAGAIVATYSRAIRQPFERVALKSFSQDLNAILVFAGFAWGAGAFLALPVDAGMSAVVLFSAGAGAVIALLLRERECAFLFLAPVAALTSFACVLRPLSGGALDASLVLIACSLVAGAIAWTAHLGSQKAELPDIAGLPQT